MVHAAFLFLILTTMKKALKKRILPMMMRNGIWGIFAPSIYDCIVESIRLLCLFSHIRPSYPKTLQNTYLPDLP